MPFKKGNSGNPAGRRPGTTNKVTTDLREWIAGFIDDNREQIKNDWQSLEPKDRVTLFERLLKYCLPVLHDTSLKTDFSTLTDDQLDELVTRLFQSNEQTAKTSHQG